MYLSFHKVADTPFHIQEADYMYILYFMLEITWYKDDKDLMGPIVRTIWLLITELAYCCVKNAVVGAIEKPLQIINWEGELSQELFLIYIKKCKPRQQ